MSLSTALLLVLVALGAFAMPLLARRLGIAGALAEILYGMLLSPLLPHSGASGEIFHFLAEFGFIVLMFLAGLEIDREDLIGLPRREFGLMLGVFSLIAAAGGLVVLSFDQPPFLVLVYLATALGLLYPILREQDLLETDAGLYLLILGSLGEVVTLAGLTLFAIYANYGASAAAGWHLLELAAFGVVSYYVLRLLRLAMWWYPGLAVLFVRTGNSSESGMRGSFLLMLGFVALAVAVDIEPIVGAFLGGILFGAVFQDKGDIQESFSAFGNGFLIPVFFIWVGASFDTRLLLDVPTLQMAAFFTLMMLLVRIPAVLPLWFSRIGWRVLVLVPFATAFPLTLLVAVAKVGLDLQIIGESLSAALILTAMIGALVFPLAFRKLSAWVLKEV